MKRLLTQPVHRLFGRFGYEIARKQPMSSDEFPPDFTPEEIAHYQAVEPYTLTGPLRTVSLTRAIEYVVRHRIPGDIVECEVEKIGVLRNPIAEAGAASSSIAAE